MENLEQEKRRHSIADWTLTVTFAIMMIVIIFSMNTFMQTHKELFLSAVIILIIFFAYAKIRLFRWGKRL